MRKPSAGLGQLNGVTEPKFNSSQGLTGNPNFSGLSFYQGALSLEASGRFFRWVGPFLAGSFDSVRHSANPI